MTYLPNDKISIHIMKLLGKEYYKLEHHECKIKNNIYYYIFILYNEDEYKTENYKIKVNYYNEDNHHCIIN